MKQISIFEMYDSLERVPTPKQIFRNTIAEITHSKPQTVKQWLCGAQVPSYENIVLIAEYYNVDPTTLFPNRKTK